MKHVRQFTQQEKDAAVARVAQGEKPTAVARDLGVTARTIWRWRVASGQVISTVGRAPNGQILPGYTPNPGGSSSNIERAQRVMEEAAHKVAQGLCDLAVELLDEQDPKRARFLADKAHALHKLGGGLLDRVLGKAAQRLKIEADAPLDADRLALLRAKLLPASQDAQDPTERQGGAQTQGSKP